MKKMTKPIWLLALSAFPLAVSAQGEFVLKSQTLANPDNEPKAVHPVPHERQMKWQETEFYAFFHYGMNTYTGLEWGYGDEKETIFAPTAAPNPRQWLEAVKKAGMRGGIAVVKHHDGFCLWPTETTNHNITRSGNDFGRNTNIPRDFAKAAKDLDLKYGFYISPWDRNSGLYGTDKYVSDVFLRQCAELAKYGTDQFEMWFDGANGGDGYYGGQGGSRTIDRETYYDVPNLRDSVHKVCPDCVLWGVGGESRWIGNEAGWAGQTNWSTENRGTAPEKNGMYGSENGWFWFPGESDAKATNRGWFYHDGESPLTPERLFQMYLETVGRNATLILNIPPNKAGVLPEASVKVLEQMGELLKKRLSNDLARKAKVEVTAERKAGAKRKYIAKNLIDGKKDTYWATDDDVHTATITLTWKDLQTLRYVDLMEYIRKGQRVKSFLIETSMDGVNWTRRAANVETTTIGYKRIIPLNGSTSNSYANGVKAKALRIVIKDSKACPLLHTVAVY
ncbi:coagulation factor 5/8 type domain protein [gut metagenome]|uniref:alpha-L-fucosidase n=1 Tax=gut metagenome TaxID=749906 RepID=J9CPU9_9ZZZZ